MIALNCRGMGTSSSVHIIKDLIGAHDPDVICLSETKATGTRMETVRKQLKYQGSHVVPADGRKGGLTVLWKEDCNVEIQAATKNYVTGKVTNLGSVSSSWVFTFVYGEPISHHRKKVWDELTSLAYHIDDPWILFGDFNAITSLDEKEGGNNIRSRSMVDFNDFINGIGLVDLGYRGSKFTWCNNRAYGSHIMERLDRALATTSWMEFFPEAKVTTVTNVSSDHLALFISLHKAEPITKKPFRFYEMWLRDDNCKNVIEHAWNSVEENESMSLVAQKQNATREKLKVWNKREFGNVVFEIRNVKKQLEKLMTGDMNERKYQKIQSLKSKLVELLEREASMWRQNSSQNWVKDYARNTKFFHISTVYRRRKNKIDKLKNEQGIWKKGREEVSGVVNSFFTNLFSTDSPKTDSSILNLFKPVITSRENDILGKIPTDTEIWNVVKKLHPLKAPGPDGFQGVFYQSCWDIVGPLITKTVKNFFLYNMLPPDLNETFITLIPKIPSPDHISKFRPISLCNFTYKIISKLLANRLKALLHKIISPFQGAFVKGRFIGDNIGLASEIFHHMSRMEKKKQGWLALKLDMKKAFDRVEWQFLYQVFEKLGFSNKWIAMIRKCLETVSYRVLLNGSPLSHILPQRGLRQGDPLSPYLFILVTEALSRLLGKAEEEKKLSGIKMRQNSPPINHLLYADDLIVFSKASLNQASNMKEILGQYCSATGQEVNWMKSSAFFSRNVHQRHQKILLRKWKVRRFMEKEKYLGVPILLGKKKGQDFEYLVDRLQKKVAGWKAKVLSQASRTTLVEAVGQTVPIYAMGVYHLPTSICDKLDQINRDFWWNGNANSNAWHTLSWEKLCKAKMNGGLGFRRARDMNMAMLAKHSWRMINDPDSIWAKTFRSLYQWEMISQDTSRKKKPTSYFWKGVVKSMDSVKEGYMWKLEDGNSIHTFTEPWLLLNNKPIRLSDHVIDNFSFSAVDDSTHVSHLLENDSTDWNQDRLGELFPKPIVECINLKEVNPTSQDKLIWWRDSKGILTVKSAYKMLIRETEKGECSKSNYRTIRRIWKLDIDAGTQLFLWKLYMGGLTTGDVLLRRKFKGDASCSFCQKEIETDYHLFIGCEWARALWMGSILGQRMMQNEKKDVRAALDSLLEWGLKKEDLEGQYAKTYALCLLEQIWKTRNMIRFEKKEFSFQEIYGHTHSHAARVYEAYQTVVTHTNVESNSEEIEFSTEKRVKYEQWHKVSCDGAYETKTGRGAAAAVCKRQDGSTLGAVYSKFRCESAMQAECKGVALAILLAQRLQISNLVVLGDNQRLMKALAAKDNSFLWSSEDNYNQIQETMTAYHAVNDSFLVHFFWIARNCNKEANQVAKWANKYAGISPPPRWLHDNVELLVKV